MMYVDMRFDITTFSHYLAPNKKQTWVPMAETLNFALRFLRFLAFKRKFMDSNDQNRGLYIGINDDRAICACW